MKTIALSMIFSLAVIVCEQQTLFAPHFVTFDNLRAQNPSNSLVPIAGVNRLVPVAGKTSSAIAIPALMGPDVSNGLQPIADPNMQNSDPTQSDPRHPEATQTGPILHGPVNNGCPPCDFELRLGLSGTAGPGATSF
jgi:hypothetical protein